jgi:ribose transport system substrate-binding protein
MKRFFGALGIAAMLAACGGCGKEPPPEPAGAATAKVIGASLLTKTHVFYQDLAAAMADEAAKHGLKLEMQYCEFDGARQNDQASTFIVKGVDALILSPNDSAAVRPVIARARSQGIPVFTVDIAADGAEVVSHIASDNVQGGRIIGEYLAGLLDGKGTVAIIDHPGTASVRDRVAGFEEAMAAHPGITIVQKAPGEGQRDKAMLVTQDVLQRMPELDAIFGINDDSALGALAAAEAAGRAEKLIIVGYDGTPEAREKILAGSALKADTVQYPEKIGRTAIAVIADHFAGKSTPAVVPVDVGIIDAETLKKEQGE